MKSTKTVINKKCLSLVLQLDWGGKTSLSKLSRTFKTVRYKHESGHVEYFHKRRAIYKKETGFNEHITFRPKQDPRYLLWVEKLIQQYLHGNATVIWRPSIWKSIFMLNSFIFAISQWKMEKFSALRLSACSL